MTYVYAKHQSYNKSHKSTQNRPQTFHLALTLDFISVGMCTSKIAGTSLQKILY